MVLAVPMKLSSACWPRRTGSRHLLGFFMSGETTSNGDDSCWHVLATQLAFNNEAEVERRFVCPLLQALGYAPHDIASQVSVTFKQGAKKGRPFQADFVAYAGAEHSLTTSLMVVEVKAFKASLADAKEQAESYAYALRAPVLLITNGCSLEVWQTRQAGESELIFESHVTDLLKQRPELERLIAKQALVKFVEGLKQTTLTGAADFTEYKHAELTRLQQRAVPRRLLAEAGVEVSSTSLLEAYGEGALIVAPSGYGKTVLSRQLVMDAIHAGLCNLQAIDAVDVPLFDFSSLGGDLLDFIYQRIKAHQPEITLAGMKQSIQAHGITLVCDGFEYVPEHARKNVESQIGLFRRDYPRVQTFIFSRSSVVLRSSLPCLKLTKLNHQEQREVTISVMGKAFPFTGMPHVLTELSEVPLLLRLIIDFFVENSAFPSRLNELFEQWLSHLRDAVASTPTDRVHFDNALLLIASMGLQRRMSASQVLKAIETSGAHAGIFDKLVSSGALLYRGTSVGFAHDALADYLHARALMDLPDGEVQGAIATVTIQADSLLPVMMILLAQTPESCALVWQKLEALPIRRYVEIARICKGAGEPEHDNAQAFLTGTLNTVEAMLNRYFPEVKGLLKTALVYSQLPVRDLAIEGGIDPEQPWIFLYRLNASRIQAPRVMQQPPSDHSWVRHLDLKNTRLNLNGGHYAAAQAIKSAVYEMVRQQNLRGGALLANERSLSRLRYLDSIRVLSVTPEHSLSENLACLRPLCDAIVPARGHNQVAFSIRSLIDDLERLQREGWQKLEWWWLPLWGNEDQIYEQPERVKAYLDAHFARASALYLEIVNTSFGCVAKAFSYFNLMPFRREAIVFGEPHERSLNWYWVPVEHATQAATVCWFEHEVGDGLFNNAATRDHIAYELIRLQRSLSAMYTTGGGGAFPAPDLRFQGQQYSFETPTLTEAMSMIKSDIEGLFWDLIH